MQDVYALLDASARSVATVLVRGESGTGKELASRMLHDGSARAAGAFIKVDCASLPEPLLESELFGYEKGAFTGAMTRKIGRIERAQQGTLFFDEIGELTLPLQAKLLRLLQDRQLERLGGTETIDVDVRVVAATHRDLESMLERGQFRQDLFYRLNVISLWLPPLRARRDDVDALAQHFCQVLGAANGRPGTTLEACALRALRHQRWPGNVRQLQNFVERLIVLVPGPTIRAEDVERELAGQSSVATESKASSPGNTRIACPTLTPAEDLPMPTLAQQVSRAEKRALERALESARQNRSLAARLLRVSRSKLYAKLEEHGLLDTSPRLGRLAAWPSR